MSEGTEKTRKEQFLENRKKLIALSKEVRELINTGEFKTVNEGVVGSYKKANKDITEFKTFWDWKREGYTILKGEKAFLVWGQPRKVEQVPEGATEPEEFSFFPVCYLFANTQVYKPETKQKTDKPTDKQQVKEELPELSDALTD